MASCLLLFYSTSLYAIYGGTDGGANEEATSQFYRRAICSKQKPTFAVKFIINLNLRLCNYLKASVCDVSFSVVPDIVACGFYRKLRLTANS